MQKRIPVLEDHSWQPPVIAIANAPTVTTAGTRYLVGTSPTGVFAGQANKIAWKDDVSWHFDTPSAGWEVAVIDVDKLYHFNGSNWVARPASGDFINANQSATSGKIPTWNNPNNLNDGYGVATGAGDSNLDTKIFRADAIKAYVDNLLGATDAMVFKGTLGTGGTITVLPTTYSAGWTYKVITAGTYAGKVCEVGDMIIAVVDRSGSGNIDADWTVVQTNIDGAVTGPASAVNGNLPSFNGTTGKVIEDSGIAAQDVIDHMTDDNIHFSEGDIDHNNIQNVGTYQHTGIDAHINASSIHRQTNYVSSLKCIVWDDASVLPTQINE